MRVRGIILALALTLAARPALAQFSNPTHVDVRGTSTPNTSVPKSQTGWASIGLDLSTSPPTIICSINAGTWLPCFGGSGGGGSVNSFAGRTGAVVPNGGDYSGAQISITPPGSGITASDVQTALNQLAARPSGVTSVFGRTGNIVAGNGDYSVTQVTGAAPLNSPALTGTPTAPTPLSSDNSTRVATTAYVKSNAVTTVFGRTGTVTALQADYDAFFTTPSEAAAAAPVQSVAGRTGTVTLGVADVSGAAPLASPALTGTPTAPTATAADSTTKIATTAFVTTADNLKANIASPTFTGTPAAPTASNGTNTTQIATTAFVQSAMSAGGVGVAASLGTTGAAVNVNAAPPPAAGNVLVATDPTHAHWSNTIGTRADGIPTDTDGGNVSGTVQSSLEAIDGAVLANTTSITSNTAAIATKAPVISPTFNGTVQAVRTSSDYGPGTILTAASGTTGVGTGTAFTTYFKPGDPVNFDNGNTYTINTITDDTHLTFTTTTTAHDGPDGRGDIYKTTARTAIRAIPNGTVTLSALTLSGACTGCVKSVAGQSGVVTLGVADVGGAAPTASPSLTGAPTAPTPTTGDNSTKIATTAFVQTTTAAAPATAVATTGASVNVSASAPPAAAQVLTATDPTHATWQTPPALNLNPTLNSVTVTTNTGGALNINRIAAGPGTMTVTAGSTSWTSSATDMYKYLRQGDQITVGGQTRTINDTVNFSSGSITPAWSSNCTNCTFTTSAFTPLNVDANGNITAQGTLIMSQPGSTSYNPFGANEMGVFLQNTTQTGTATLYQTTGTTPINTTPSNIIKLEHRTATTAFGHPGYPYTNWHFGFIGDSNFRINYQGPSDVLSEQTKFMLDSDGAQYERGRTVAQGDWATFTPTMTASTGTWTGGTVTTAKYMLIGKTMWVTIYISGSSVSATPTTLAIAIPGGFTSAVVGLGAQLQLSNNGTAGTGSVATTVGGTTLTLYQAPFGTGSWATSTTNTGVAFTAAFEIQ